MLKVAFHTLGCKVNQQETDAVTAQFLAAGFQSVQFDAPADIYIINSCAVTEAATRKSKAVARRQKKKHPKALLVLAGCFPQVALPEALSMGMDLLIGSNDKSRIVELVQATVASNESQVVVTPWREGTAFETIADTYSTARTRGTIKVQDGCAQFCAYCIIPYARGPERSLAKEAVLRQAQILIDQGSREIVLSGIHLGAYGRDLQPRLTLAELIESLATLPGLARLRLGSVEPRDVTPEFVAVMRAHQTVCRHLHIPLQSGSNDVLKRMERPYAKEQFKALVDVLRFTLPDIGLTSDLIVGFPGETEAEFNESLAFTAEIAFARAHVFRYSPRQGTKAAQMNGQISENVKENRYQKMQKVAQGAQQQFAERQLGQVVEVLTEGEQGGYLTGYSSSYLKAYFRGTPELRGRVVNLRLDALFAEGAVGTLL